MVHEKRIGPSTRFYVHNFGRPSTRSDLAYKGAHAVFKYTIQQHVVTCKRRLVHVFFAKYMLQIGYIMVSKFYLHLFIFLVLFQ